MAMAVLSILAAIALPNLQPLMRKYQLNGAARQVMGDLMAARMKAVSQHRKVKLFFSESHEYNVCDDADGDGTVDNGEGTVHIQDLQTNYSGVSVSATNNPTFSSMGTEVYPFVQTIFRVE
jgi:type IV fimbrial biogenesis protein FimT